MSDGQAICLEFSLCGSKFESAGEASSKIKQVLQQIGVPSEVIRRIAISAYEAEMNVIIHAFRGWMKASISPEKTEIALEDEGPGIADIELAMQEGYSTAPDHIRAMGFGAGMGLPNISRCVDQFDISSEIGVGTKIYIVIDHKIREA
ncbi:MAG: anti-sigma regulatory factor [Sporomusaceae bacterium]|nr:anti-sigma regulatory factor [Sporomusaceae bacterium]